MSLIWLTCEELEELTGYKTKTRQAAALIQLGIPYRARPADGFPLVERRQFEGQKLTGQRKPREPNWDFLRGSKS
jgi:hypothetical protein